MQGKRGKLIRINVHKRGPRGMVCADMFRGDDLLTTGYGYTGDLAVRELRSVVRQLRSKGWGPWNRYR